MSLLIHILVAAGTILLTVLPPAMLAPTKITTETLTFLEGSSPEIPCPLTDHTSVIWSSGKEGGIAIYTPTQSSTVDDTSYKLNGANLTLINVAKTRTDIYTCKSGKSNTDHPIYDIPVVIAVKPKSKMITSYNKELIAPAVSTNITCTVPESSPAATIKFYMKKQNSLTFAEIFSNVYSNIVDGDESTGSRMARLEYAFYPEHNGYVFRCQADISTLVNVDSVEFTPNVDTTKYKSAGIRLAFLDGLLLTAVLLAVVFI